MPDTRWKKWERWVAARISSVWGICVHRNPNTGESKADINAGHWSIQVKERMTIAEYIGNGMAQARRDTREGETPVVVLIHSPGDGRKATVYAIMDFEDWLVCCRD